MTPGELRDRIAAAVPEWTGLCDDEFTRLADDLLPVVRETIARIETAAEKRGEDRVRAKVGEVIADMTRAIDSGYYGGSEYEDAAASLRAAVAPQEAVAAELRAAAEEVPDPLRVSYLRDRAARWRDDR